ncbi:MAG TPA: hypothetical protein VEZ43_02845, partial [Dongiaceae bacterium]|nr:hypothetical protein [Dongiaceae bacterium]
VCHSTLVAATYQGNDTLRKVVEKKKRGTKLSVEEEHEWFRASRSAGLIQNYGKHAAVVLAARGVGPTTGARILRARTTGDEDFYLNILKAEREFERTRMFWD